MVSNGFRVEPRMAQRFKSLKILRLHTCIGLRRWGRCSNWQQPWLSQLVALKDAMFTGKVHRVGTIVGLGTGPGERDVDEGWDIRASAPTVQCLSWASSSSASRHHRIPMHGARDAIYICEYDKGFTKWMGECARYLGSLVV